ncbi:hypothetical protein MNBD_GAMMA25-248 [hydrothermal vent metagenome]|uniref:General secretion pathway GspH domain-containing protein n=1 Tax=hydrothermal vent metagenome TaxID=652676 RepID=A0A3B1BZH5_9ZZZZ
MKTSHGLTLIELMVTLAVFAIITALAFPGFRLYQQNSNRVSQINDLVAVFNMTRSEAVKRNLAVTVCASTDQATCSNANNWTTGWIVFIDDNENGAVDATDGNGTFDAGAGELILILSHGALSGANLVYTDIANGTVAVRFNAQGTPTVFNAAAVFNTNAVFMRCDNRAATQPVPLRNNHARGIILTASGRTRLSRDSNNNGVQENDNNVDFVCP